MDMDEYPYMTTIQMHNQIFQYNWPTLVWTNVAILDDHLVLNFQKSNYLLG
jgi:hypothetical protein